MMSTSLPALCWAVVILMSYTGWGRTLASLASRRRMSSFEEPGFFALGGMSLTIIGFGAALAIGPGASIVWWFGGYIAAGAILACVGCRAPLPRSRHDIFLAVVLGIAVFAALAASVNWLTEFDYNDDFIAYFGFPQKILQTGEWNEPFSMRRAVTLGGQPILQAVSLVFGTQASSHMTDVGIAKAIIIMLVLGACRELRNKNALLWVALGIIIVVLPTPRINTSSVNTSLACLLGTLFILTGPAYQTRWGLVMLVLSTAAAATFRIHIGAVCGLFIIGRCVCDVWDKRQTWPQSFWRCLAIGASSLAACLPLMWLLYRDCGTPLFPPFCGNIDAIFAGMHSGGKGLLGESWAAFVLLTDGQIVAIWLPSLIILYAIKPDKFGLWVAIAAIGMTVATAYMTTELASSYFFRYVWPIPMSLFIWTVASALQKSVWKGLWFPLAVGIWLFTGSTWQTLYSTASETLYAASGIMARPAKLLPPDGLEEYNSLQTQTPAGSKILVMVESSYLLDFTRNKIFNVDMPGAVSPLPGLPVGKGPQALVSYLRGLDICYILRVQPDKAGMFYRRDFWENVTRPEKFYKTVWAPPMLDLMKSLDWLSRHKKTITQGRHEMIQIDGQQAQTETRK